MSKKNRTSKILIITTVVIISLAAIGIFLLRQYANPYVRNKITEQLDSLEQSPLQLKYDSFTLDISAGHFAIMNASIKSESDSTNTYEVKFDRLVLNGFGVFSYLLNKKISINDFKIQSPEIIITQRTQNKQDSIKSKPPAGLPYIKIKHFDISDGTIKIINADTSASATLLTADFKINMTKLYTDSTEAHTYKYFDIDESDIVFSNITFTPDSIYKYKLQKAEVRLDKKSLTLDSIDIASNYEKFKLGREVGYEIDWMDVSIPSINFKNIDFKKAINDTSYHIGSITINDLTALIFRDKRLRFPEKPNTKLLKETLASLTTKIRIDTIMVKKANIEYQEFVKQAYGPGHVSFNNLYASFYNFANTDSLFLDSVKHTAYMDAQCKIMGQGLLKASFTFPLNNQGPTYAAKGSLGAMDLTQFNPMLEYVGFTRIKEGQLHHLDFNFTYNNNKSDGEMYFEYEGLKISTLDKENHTSEGLGESIKTFIANTFVVKTNNMKDDGKFRVGKIEFERDKKKSILNYWWKSLLTGFRSSTGIEAPEERIDIN
ncbi:hypothetical protein [Fulvivirga ligni]|uniref:hypothetical protein n=1 Tax=Fulvivirga ligni TaxID=2904246 RepID=UPI001F3C204A|nr:hypothetical protein [Fulvivirga ligni]UII20047.1 hypothetical protein LVD16_19570 [Fulvivirga ligni]